MTVIFWCYARLLRLYPRAFRAQYGGAMLQAFRDRCRDGAGRQSPLGTVGVCARGFVDLVTNAALERVMPEPGGPPPPRRQSPLDALMSDVRIGLRRLVREPGFTAIVVITLALGIGATTTIFSVVEGVLLRPLPYRDADRLVTLWQWSQAKGIDEPPAPANFFDWREASRLVDLAAAIPFGLDLTGSGDPIALDTWVVSERFFETLGVSPMLGRPFAADENQPGRSRVVLLSHHLWQTRFGSDPAIVGRTLTLDANPYVVVGVMPPHIDYPSRKDIWVPQVAATDARRLSRVATYYQVIGRLKRGITVNQARAELTTIAERLAAAYPRTNKGVGITVAPLFDRMTGPVRPALLLLFAGVACLLLIACANAANLMLARAAARQSEVGVRTALGASRWHLLRLALVESTLVALGAAAIGVVTSYWTVAVLVRLAPADIPRVDQVALNVDVLVFAVAVAAATALVCGLAPAAQFWRAGLDGVLRAQGRVVRGRGVSAALVAVQTGLAVTLLAASGLLVRSFSALLDVDLGYRVDNRVALTLHAWDLYPQPDRRLLFIEEVEQRMAAQPGVISVGTASALPLSHEGSEADPPYTIVGRPAPQPGDEPTALVTFVTPRYFETMGMRLVTGRLLSDRDAPSSLPVVVVNETMARHAWPGARAVGQQIRSTVTSFDGAKVREVVGVVGDVRQTGLHDRPQPTYYVPIKQVPFGSVTFVVRTAGDPARVVPALQHAVWSIQPAMTFGGVETMNTLLRETLAARRFTLTLLSGFSLAALVLAAIGVYGLVSFSVNRRTAEIGIRMALGAGVSSVTALVMRQGLTIASAGLACGLASALLLTRYLTTMLFGVEPTDALTFGVLSATVLVVMAVACYVPARRAARVDPISAIRVE